MLLPSKVYSQFAESNADTTVIMIVKLAYGFQSIISLSLVIINSNFQQYTNRLKNYAKNLTINRLLTIQCNILFYIQWETVFKD